MGTGSPDAECLLLKIVLSSVSRSMGEDGADDDRCTRLRCTRLVHGVHSLQDVAAALWLKPRRVIVNSCARRLGSREKRKDSQIRAFCSAPLQEPPTGGTPHGIGLQLLQAMVPQGGGGGGGGACVTEFGEGLVGGRRPDPGLLVPNASRQEAEANSAPKSLSPKTLHLQSTKQDAEPEHPCTYVSPC